jgi:hypothetical protein
MFSDESVIEVNRRRGGSVVVVVPSNTVVHRNGGSFVRAEVVDCDNGKWAILPTEYREFVAVEDGAIESPR